MHVGSEKVKTRLGERSLSTLWLQNAGPPRKPGDEKKKKKNKKETAAAANTKADMLVITVVMNRLSADK